MEYPVSESSVNQLGPGEIYIVWSMPLNKDSIFIDLKLINF